MLSPKLSAAMALTICSDSIRFEACKARTCFVRKKTPHSMKVEKRKYLFIILLFGFGVFFFFIFSSYLWRDGEKVTAELQEKGVHRPAVQAAFKATFRDKKIKHNQSNNFPFLLPKRPCKISAFRRIEGEAAPWTRQSITHQLPVRAPDSSPMGKERCTLGE